MQIKHIDRRQTAQHTQTSLARYAGRVLVTGETKHLSSSEVASQEEAIFGCLVNSINDCLMVLSLAYCSMQIRFSVRAQLVVLLIGAAVEPPRIKLCLTSTYSAASICVSLCLYAVTA